MDALLAPLSRLSASISTRQQKSCGLWDPRLWGAAVNGAGNLSLDEVDIPSLVAEFGSPLLAVSRSKLKLDAESFAAAVEAALPGSMVAFSYKTNCIPGVLRELHNAGFAAEVISPYELWLAEKLGMAGDRIVVNGVNKDYEFLQAAVRVGAASINIDDPGELAHLGKAAAKLRRKARLSLRLKVDRKSHFGLAIESGEAESVARAISESPQLFDFTGLHFHAVADNDDPALHAAYMTRALEFAKHIKSTLGLTTANLNIGGGYTVPTMKVMSRFEYARQRFLGVPARPPDPHTGVPFSTYIASVARTLEAYCKSNDLTRPRVILEPGRIVTSQSHVMLTLVHAIRQNTAGPDFAMTDAGKILTSYPCDYEYHQMFAANRMRDANVASYHLMGRLCTSADWLAKFRCLPKLEGGDVLAIMDAGAYFTSYASNFAFPRPEVVMLDEGNAYTLRRRETYEHLTAMDDMQTSNSSDSIPARRAEAHR
jgi:diaminopimelate decarboxylase